MAVKVKEQGDLVRQLKADKASKEVNIIQRGKYRTNSEIIEQQRGKYRTNSENVEQQRGKCKTNSEIFANGLIFR